MNDSTLLLRQIHPNFMQNNRPSSQAFRPTPKDESKLSVYDGDQIAPLVAWEHFTCELRLKSCGVMAVSVAECIQEELQVNSDPTPFPEHMLIDFSAHGKGAIEKKAKVLKAKAEKRGWLFQESMA